MTTETSQFEIGETIYTNGTGPIASRLTDFEPGRNVETVTVSASELEGAIQRDLRDSYDDVHVFCDGETLAVCDHSKPIDGADVDTLGESDPGVLRTEVLETGEDTPRTQVKREAVLTSLWVLDANGDVTVSVEEDYPFVISDGEDMVAIAPCVRPEDVPAGADQ